MWAADHCDNTHDDNQIHVIQHQPVISFPAYFIPLSAISAPIHITSMAHCNTAITATLFNHNSIAASMTNIMYYLFHSEVLI